MAYYMKTPIIGAQAIGTTSSTQATAHDLGDHVQAYDSTNNVGEFVYVIASAAIIQNDCVWVKEDFETIPITNAAAELAGFPAVAATAAFAADEYGWVLIKGKTSVRVAADADAGAELYVTASAGVLDDPASLSNMIQGIVLVGSATGTVTAVSATVNYPAVFRKAS